MWPSWGINLIKGEGSTSFYSSRRSVANVKRKRMPSYKYGPNPENRDVPHSRDVPCSFETRKLGNKLGQDAFKQECMALPNGTKLLCLCQKVPHRICILRGRTLVASTTGRIQRWNGFLIYLNKAIFCSHWGVKYYPSLFYVSEYRAAEFDFLSHENTPTEET